MKVNTELIKKTLNDYKKDILDICTSDNITIDTLSTKIENIKDNVNTFSTLSLFIDDTTFVKETTALSLISERLIDNQFDFFENKDFKSSLIDSLCNMGIDLNTDPTPSNDNLEETIVDNDINKEIENTIDNDKNKIKDKKKLSKEYNDLTPKEKVDLLVEDANNTISSYFHSAEDMKKYLDYMSKFYKYSPRNIALIENQFKGAKAVGSFKFWKDNGFTVKKGEKGIKILVPAKVKYIILDDENIKQLKYATKEEKEKVKKGILQTIEKQYYKTGYVFEISQTNATEKDLPKLFPNKWLDGEVKDYDKMYKAMEKIAATIGVKIIEPIEEMGVAKGYSLTETKEVALNPRNSQLQNVKTLLHELAHAKLHNIETRNNYSKQEREYQAEMIAYTTCSYFDIDTSDYSFDYIYNWTRNMDFDESIKIIEEVKETSIEYIQIIEDYLNDEPYMDMSSNDDEKEKHKGKNENIDNTFDTDFEKVDITLLDSYFNDFGANLKTKKRIVDDYFNSKNINEKSRVDLLNNREFLSLLDEKEYLQNSIMCINDNLKSFGVGSSYDEINEYINMSKEDKSIIDNSMNRDKNLLKDKLKISKVLENIVDDNLNKIIDNKLDVHTSKSYSLKTYDNSNVTINNFKNGKYEVVLNNDPSNTHYFTESQLIKLCLSKDKNNENLLDKDISEKISSDDVFVCFTSSESNTIEKGDIYDFDTANELLHILNEKYLYLNTPMKTTFELHLDENCSKPIYLGNIELGNPNEYDLKSNLDRTNNKDNIYVKFLWSENINIQENSIFEFDKANKLLEELTETHISENKPGYNKTKFELHFNKECTDKFYTGRFDIGDGEYNNLKEYIYDSQYLLNKNILFETIEIKDAPNDKSMDKDIDMDF